MAAALLLLPALLNLRDRRHLQRADPPVATVLPIQKAA
jgi:hypothetical protein